MRRTSPQTVLLLACLTIGLLFDPMGFLRMALLCSLVHEGGHILAFWLCCGIWPGIALRLGGAALSGAQRLSRRQELVVLCAGPLANFALAAGLFLRAWVRASYGVYFLAAVSLCVGAYNLLPLGTLDGGRIIQNLLPAEQCGRFAVLQHWALRLCAAAGVWLCLSQPLPPAAKCAAVLAPVYLLAQERLAR